MTELVADASALVELVLRTEIGERIADALTANDFELHVPSLCDVEVASVFRGLSLSGRLTDMRLRQAQEDYLALPLERHGHVQQFDEILRLRHNFSSYDAAYVTLAVDLGTGLLTADQRLSRAVDQTESVDLETWLFAQGDG